MSFTLQVKHLSKVYGKDPEHAFALASEGLSRSEIFEQTQQLIALKDVTFGVNKGEILVVMGPSGCGKSTLARAINGLIHPDKGEILIDGANITQFNSSEIRDLRQNRISMVFQSFNLLPHRNVLKNVTFGLELRKDMSKKKRHQLAIEALELVGLEKHAQAQISELSGGMKQRVGLARALACQTDFLIMDEAFSALDPINRGQLQDELLKLQKRVNKTIIFITHDVEESLKLADRMILLREGALIQQGTPQDLLQNPQDAFVTRFLGQRNV